MANCITIAKGMQFWGTHGFFPEENKFGAKFVVDITAESDERPASARMMITPQA